VRRIFPGWYVAAVCFLANLSSVGFAYYAFGVFVTPLTAEFGWSRAELNAAISFSVFSGLAGPALGVFMDRYGPRSVMLISLPLVGLGYLFRAGIDSLWQFYALSALTALAQAGEASLTTPVLISNWFQRRRGRIMGLALMGANAGGLLIPPLTAVGIAAFGWRTTYLLFAVLPLLVTLPLTYFLVRDRPEERGLRPYGAPPVSGFGFPVSGPPPQPETRNQKPETLGAALRTRAFWLIAGVFFSSSVAFTVALTQLVPHLERVGIDRGVAAATLGIASAFAGGAKPLAGYLSERFPTRYILIGCFVLQALGILILLRVRDLALLIPFVPIFGMGYGGVGVLLPTLVSEAFGLAGFGKIFSVLSLSGAFAAVIGAPVAGLIFDATGGYGPAFAALLLFYAAGAACMLLLRPPQAAVGAART
jgi:MFS family permease